MTTYNSVKLLSRSSLQWCATFGNRETRRLPNWRCFRSSMHRFHVLQRFVADEDFGSLTIQRPAFMIYTGIAFWSPFGRHVLQSIQSFGGSFVASICILFDEFVFDDAHVTDRKSCKGSGQRAMQFMHRASFSFGHVNASSTNRSIS